MHTLNLYFRLIAAQVRSQMQYRFSFWSDLLTTAMLNGMEFLTIVLLFERFGSIAGWTLGEVAFLAGMMEISFALMDLIFSGFDYDYFANYVRLGTFDQMLLRPVNITLQVLGSRFVLRRLGRVMEGSLIFAIALVLTNIHWTTARLLYLPIVLISQVLAFGSLFIFGSTITFWTVERIEAVNILTYGGNALMSYPMEIYPTWMRRIFTYIIPFIFMNYYPALFFLEKPDPLGFPPIAPFLAPLVGIGMLLISLRFWQFGINHYHSTGS
ncbi:MAG TPA: ABC-2 family transporter protein [Anaerolineaceae bacterium]